MKRHVFKKNHGKGRMSRTYYATYQCDGMPRAITINLGVTEKRTAFKRLDKLMQEAENEINGIGISKTVKETAKRHIIELVKDFISTKKAVGRTENYTATIQNFIVKVCKECNWQYLEHITASGFEAWRMEQDKAPKTLNEYLNAFNVF